MRKLGLIGDTQGRYKVDALIERVVREFRDVDEIWHAGDWQDERVLEGLEAMGKPLTVVNGNAPDDPRYPMQVVRRVEQLEVGMVHRPPRPADDWIRKCDIVIHGHTHRWRDETLDGIRFINVSTPTAAGFTRERTIGILTIDGRESDLRRIDL